MSAPHRRQLADRKGGVLSIRRQCTLLAIARSGLYRPPSAANDNGLADAADRRAVHRLSGAGLAAVQHSSFCVSALEEAASTFAIAWIFDKETCCRSREFYPVCTENQILQYW